MAAKAQLRRDHHATPKSWWARFAQHPSGVIGDDAIVGAGGVGSISGTSVPGDGIGAGCGGGSL